MPQEDRRIVLVDADRDAGAAPSVWLKGGHMHRAATARGAVSRCRSTA